MAVMSLLDYQGDEEVMDALVNESDELAHLFANYINLNGELGTLET